MVHKQLQLTAKEKKISVMKSEILMAIRLVPCAQSISLE